MEEFGLKDLLYVGGFVTTIVLSWASVRYEGQLNKRDIESLQDEMDKLNSKCDLSISHDYDYEARLRAALSMEDAEKKFVTRREFDLTIKQLDVDVKATKSIAQNTLDTLQTFVMHSRAKE